MLPSDVECAIRQLRREGQNRLYVADYERYLKTVAVFLCANEHQRLYRSILANEPAGHAALRLLLGVDEETKPTKQPATDLLVQILDLIREWIANGRSGYSLPVIRGELLDQLVAQAEAGDAQNGRADSPAAPLPAEAATDENDAALKLWREVKAMPKIGTMMVQVTKSEFRNVQCYWDSLYFFTIFEGGDGVTLNRNEARQIALRILANNSERMVGDGRKPTPGRDQRDATG
jgi:hypothetical protein